MKFLAALIFSLAFLQLSAQQDSALHRSLMLKDSLHFHALPGEILNNSLTTDSLVMKKDLLRAAHFEDSLGGVAVLSLNGDKPGQKTFLIHASRGDSLLVSAFKTANRGHLEQINIHFLENRKLVELQYQDDKKSEDHIRQWKVSAFFIIDGRNVQPVARLVTSLWIDEHGAYNPECKDFNFHSCELKRNARVRRDELRITAAKYREAKNMECKYSTVEVPLAGAAYRWNGTLFTQD